MRRILNKISRRKRVSPDIPLNRNQALKLMEISYLAALSALIWIGLYYLPFGGALFRLALPLPLALLQVRRGFSSGIEGVTLNVFLLCALMGPIRGPLILFPYGLLALWLGWSWRKSLSWWFSWGFGVFIGTFGFLIRVVILSLLVGENLWVIITRAGSGFLDKLLALFNFPTSPDILQVQIMAIGLVIIQEVIYVLAIHALAYWIFPKLNAHIPEPPRLLNGIVAFESI